MNKVVEFVKFKQVKGTDEAKFLDAADAMMEDVSKSKGFIKRELLKGKDDVWADLVHWETMEDAQNAMKEVMKHKTCQLFFSMIDESSTDMNHFEIKREYN